MQLLRTLSIYNGELAYWHAAELHGEQVVALRVIDAAEAALKKDAKALWGLGHPGLLGVRRLGGCTAILDGFDGVTLAQVWSQLEFDDTERQSLVATLVSQIAQAATELEARSLPLHLTSGTVLVSAQGRFLLVPPFHHLFKGAAPSYAQHPLAYELGFAPIDEPNHSAPSLVYHLGTVLHRLATGVAPPWEHSLDEKTLEEWVATARETQGPLQPIVATCLAPSSRDRFRSVGLLAEALDKLPKLSPVSLQHLSKTASSAAAEEAGDTVGPTW